MKKEGLTIWDIYSMKTEGYFWGRYGVEFAGNAGIEYFSHEDFQGNVEEKLKKRLTEMDKYHLDPRKVRYFQITKEEFWKEWERTINMIL